MASEDSGDARAAKKLKVDSDEIMTSSGEDDSGLAAEGASRDAGDTPTVDSDTQMITSSEGGSGLTSEGASRDASGIPTLARSHPYSRLSQELKDKIHEYVMLAKVDKDGVVEIMDSWSSSNKDGGGGVDHVERLTPNYASRWLKARSHKTGVLDTTESSLWNYTEAFQPLRNQADFEAASSYQRLFLRRYHKFKATCYTTAEVGEAWNRYAHLTALLESPRSPASFQLVVKEDHGNENRMMNAVISFYIQAARQLTGAERHFRGMFLQSVDLRLWVDSPGWNFQLGALARRWDSLLQSSHVPVLELTFPTMEWLQILFSGTHNVVADLVADPDFINRLWRMLRDL